MLYYVISTSIFINILTAERVVRGGPVQYLGVVLSQLCQP